MIGLDVESLLKTIKQGGANDRAVKDLLGSSVSEMEDLFGQLIQIKKS